MCSRRRWRCSCAREREIEAFAPAGDEVVDAAFEPASGSSRYLARWVPGAAADVAGVAAALRAPWATCRRSPSPARNVPPPPPYDLEALQRDALQLYGMRARRSADAAYACYEQAALTYPGSSAVPSR